MVCLARWPGMHPHRLQHFQLYVIVGGSCCKYHFCRAKACLLLQQKHVCHEKLLSFCHSNMFVTTKVLSRQAHFCHDKRCVLSQQTRLCCDRSMLIAADIFPHKTFVMTSILLLQQKTCFVSTNVFGIL